MQSCGSLFMYGHLVITTGKVYRRKNLCSPQRAHALVYAWQWESVMFGLSI